MGIYIWLEDVVLESSLHVLTTWLLIKYVLLQIVLKLLKIYGIYGFKGTRVIEKIEMSIFGLETRESSAYNRLAEMTGNSQLNYVIRLHLCKIGVNG